MAKEGTPHNGILYRGATGELWFLRDDHDHPTRVDDLRLKELFSAHVKEAASGDVVGRDLPEDIIDILNDLFGPVIGAWWVWGP